MDQDNSDAQYRSFRNGLPGLLALASVYLLASAVHSRASPSVKSRSDFLLISSILTLIALHGISAWKVIAIIYLNYQIVKSGLPSMAGRYWPGISIVGNMVILLLNETYNGYDFALLYPYLATPVSLRKYRKDG
jgi:hypothetical protein